MKRLLTIAAATLLSLNVAQAQTVLNRGSSVEPQTVDPAKASLVQEANVAWELFEGLITYDAKANPVPGAAESWTVSDDGKVYTFTLREGLKWSNGDPVTAEDFVFAWRRVVDTKTASPYASMLFPVKNAEKIKTSPADEETAKKENKTITPVEELGARAIDARTFEVTLEAPTPFFLKTLVNPATYPVPKAVVEKLGADWVKPGNMVSNGAYVLKDFIPKDKIIIEKNKNYRDAANVKIDIVNYHAIEDRSAAMKRFEAGEIDSYDDVLAEQMKSVREKFGDQFLSGPYLGTYYFWFKNDKAPYNNPKLRRALSMMIDRDYLSEKIWAGTMVAGFSLVPPGIAGYEPQDPDFAKMTQLEREDEAKKIMDELGYGPSNPLKIEIRFNTSENHRNTTVEVANRLKPFGVEATLFNTDGKTHYGHLRQRGDFDLARANWVGDYRDPHTYLLLGVTNDGHNYGVYSNPAYDKLVAASAIETDVAKRLEMMKEAERMIVNEQPMIILLHYRSKNLVSKRVHGWETNIMDAHLSRWLTKN